MSFRKRKDFNETRDKHSKKHRTSSKGINFYIPLHKLHLSANENENDTSTEKVEEKTYSQKDVTALLAKQQEDFRYLLEEKLKEQYLMFNQFYINNIFKEYEKDDFSYIG
jgi:hypothetical protein